MNSLSWEDLLNENENKFYSDSDFKQEIEKVNQNSYLIGNEEQNTGELCIETNKRVETFKEKLKSIKFKKALTEQEIINYINKTKCVQEFKRHKFPQANTIETAIYTLNKIINENQFKEVPPKGSDLSELYGFTERQGNYYGDFLEYLGFLEKDTRYYPTEKAMKYKRANEEERVTMIIYSILDHETLRKYYLLKKEAEITGVKSEDYINILRNDSLMKDFTLTTIKRRKSTVESMMKWIDKVTIPSPKPFIKWAGGKQKIIKELLIRLPDKHTFDNYIEPFAGGSALLYRVNFKKAVVNDINSELINTYKQIKDNPGEVYNLLKTYKNNKEDFYKIREKDRTENYLKNNTDVERAARFIYLNKTCFNGLYRVNSKGYFNTPFGHYKTDNYKNKEVLDIDSKFFNDNNIQFFDIDFEEVLKFADKRSFIYLDPPYDPISSTANFTSYTDQGFGIDDQIRLKQKCDELTKIGSKIMISNHNTSFIRELFKDDSRYNYEIINVRRTIASHSKFRGEVEEVIITNY